MKFSDLHRGRLRFRLGAGAALLAAAVLAACGGGEQEETFHAQRVVVFGDRASTLNSDGTKYTVNADTADCSVNQIWVQHVATGYGLSLCSGNARVLNAAPDDRVADVKAKIDAYLASGPRSTDLVTIYVGANDVIEQYKANGLDAATAPQEAAMFSAVRSAGTELGRQVLRVTASGAKVVILSLPDLSVSPYGRSQALPGPNRLHRLSVAFNDNLRLALGADPNGGGRSGALVEAYDLISLFIRNENNQFGTITNNSQAACGLGNEATLPTQCNVTSSAAITGSPSGYTTWLWASDYQLTPLGHALLGSQALTRLRGNPL